MQALWEGSQWISSPKGYWTIKYEYQRSGKDMQYRFYWKVWISSGGWFWDAVTLSLFLNGIEHTLSVKGYNANESGWSYEGTTGWYTVSNKTSGTVPFYAQLWDVSPNPDVLKATSSSHDLNVSPAEATLVSAPDFTDEQNPTITYSNPAGNNVTSLQACISFDGSKDDVVYRDIPKTGTSYTFNLTEAERNVLRNGTPGKTRTVIFYVRTVISGVTYGSTLAKTLSIVNANPTFTASQISYTDTKKVFNGIGGDDADGQKIVQNQSSLSVTFGAASVNKGAEKIVQYALSVNGVTKTATASGTVSFGEVNSSQNVTLSVTATDSRGYSTTVEKTIEVLAWSLPTFTAKVERVNNYEDETDIVIDASVSSVGGKNYIKSISYQIMEVGGSYGSPVPIENQTKITIHKDANGNPILPKEKDFFFLITVEDAFDYDNKELYLAKGKFPLFIDTEKYAVGVNEFPEEGEAMRVAGGVARFDNGIVLVTASKKFLLSVNDSGSLIITEMK